MTFGVALDIDGVLVKDEKPIKGAAESLQLLQQYQIPFVFVTNGGGDLEAKKAQTLAAKFNIPVTAEQVILSHTPMKQYASMYKQKRVMLVGHHKEQNLQVFQSYGYDNVEYLDDFIANHPYLCPYTQKPAQKTDDQLFYKTPNTDHEEPIAAIFVIETPYNWHEASQVLFDILASDGRVGHLVENQVVKIYFSNPDLFYSGQFKYPRFTQGAFRECLSHLYQLMMQKPLDIVLVGKPTSITYIYATQLFEAQGKQEIIYAVGDNPKSDILGANSQGWFSILVRTGCFAGGDNDVEHPAKHVCQDISEAIQFILKKHGKIAN